MVFHCEIPSKLTIKRNEDSQQNFTQVGYNIFLKYNFFLQGFFNCNCGDNLEGKRKAPFFLLKKKSQTCI